MNVTDSLSTSSFSAGANQVKAAVQAVFDRAGKKTDASARPTDIVEISELYRTMQSTAATAGIELENGYQMYGSTQGTFAGASVSELRKYIQNSELNDVGLASINASRESLGRKIDSALRDAGIQLAKDEKISITVGPDNKVKVAGVKDKRKAEAIEKALNDDKKLTQDIRRHYALGKINSAIKQRSDFANQHSESTGLDEMFTNRGLRSFVIDDYLQDKAGVRLSDLSVSIADGVTTINGANADLTAMFTEDATLAKTVANILENGEQSNDFGITFDFANGAIADGETETAAKEKVKTIQTTIMKLLDEYNKNVIGDGGAAMEGMEELLADGFSIRVRKGGGFEIVGAENMSGTKVSNLTAIVNKALIMYEEMGIDPYTGGAATGSFGDVAETMIESHRFEQGDTEEFSHEVEIALKGFFVDMKVVSKSADEEREKMTQGVADGLGHDLRGLLESEGIDVGEGIEVEVGEDGKLKVVGDLTDPNLKHAQDVLDTFARQAKTSVRAADRNDPEKSTAEEERRDARSGAPKTERERIQALNDDANPGGVFSPNVARREMPDYADSAKDAQARHEIIKDSFTAAVFDGSFTSGGGKNISMVRERRYVNGDPSRALSGAGVGGLSIMRDEKNLYSDDARGKYLNILDSFGQFHTVDRGRKFSFMIA